MEKKSLVQLSAELDAMEVELGRSAEAYAKQAVACLVARRELRAKVATMMRTLDGVAAEREE